MLLGGPRVEQVSPPGMEKTFGHALANNPMVVRDSIGMTVYTKMLAALEDDVALNEEQRKTSKELDTGWRHQYAAYFASKLPELEAVHGALPEAEAKRMAYLLRSGRQAIDRGYTMDVQVMELATPMADTMAGAMNEEMTGSMSGSMSGSMLEAGAEASDAQGASVGTAADARALLSRVRRGAPLPWEAQSRIWKLLTNDQRDAMTEQLLSYRLERRHAREVREMKRAAVRSGGVVGPTLLEYGLLLKAAAHTGTLPEGVYRMLTDEDRVSLEVLAPEERASVVRSIAHRLIAQESSLPTAVGTKVGMKETGASDGGKPVPSLEMLAIPSPDEKNLDPASETPQGLGG